jgi:hypothetical protein
MPAISGIHINIMLAAVPLQIAASLDKALDQLVALQTATSISMVLDSGCAGMSISSITMR